MPINLFQAQWTYKIKINMFVRIWGIHPENGHIIILLGEMKQSLMKGIKRSQFKFAIFKLAFWAWFIWPTYNDLWRSNFFHLRVLGEHTKWKKVWPWKVKLFSFWHCKRYEGGDSNTQFILKDLLIKAMQMLVFDLSFLKCAIFFQMSKALVFLWLQSSWLPMG